MTLSFVGDVMLMPTVEKSISEYGDDYIFGEVRDCLCRSDVVFGNLEAPISTRGTPLKFKNVTFRAAPNVVATLKRGCFDVVSVANNHIFDYGEEALLDTLDILRESGISPVGAGSNRQEAYQPVTIEKAGLSVAFIACAFPCEATRRKKHEAQAAELDFKTVGAMAQTLKAENDLVIASIHTGIEYIDQPIPDVRESCLDLLNAGVDIIIGTHPHVLQAIETLDGKVIAYSLGNFVCGRIAEAKNDDRIWKSGILQVHIEDKKVMGYDLLPVRIRSSGQPYLLKGEQKLNALAEMKTLSDMLRNPQVEKNFWRLAGHRAVNDTIPVFIRKCKQQGLPYFIETMSHIRPKHFRLIWNWLYSRICGI
jgi:poly-gamma-glutamate capsule biosynthesis protein CapA/YwtB (metallophosphatase superfamily)